MPSPTWPAPSSPDAGQSVGSGGALLSLSPVTTVEVLLICISGAVILHFITRYLYLRAHRQLALEGLQQAAATSASPGNHSNQSPGNVPQPGVEMHTVKPTVIVVQPDEEVCCGVEEEQKGGPSDQQLSSSAQGSQRKPEPQR
ncbi:g11537 [Coccomyxa viridis]|uniref:G11537 protein n=1 Tax=Coccomyxa viridis TaxID=1274662 RepID=A0ABP1GCK2_9CHLO